MQLLTDCTLPEPLLTSPFWSMDEKLDGDRCQITKNGREVTALSRNGNPMRLTDETIALAMLSEYDWTIDGEMMPGGKFIAFDLTAYASQPFHREQSTRREALEALSPFPCVRRAIGEQEKRDLLQQIADERGEGVVFKLITGFPVNGRGDHWQRYKFYESDTFTVSAIDLAKGSLFVEKDGIQYGKVAGPHFTKLPVVGNKVRVRYDRITEKGKLLRGRFIKTEAV